MAISFQSWVQRFDHNHTTTCLDRAPVNIDRRCLATRHKAGTDRPKGFPDSEFIAIALPIPATGQRKDPAIPSPRSGKFMVAQIGKCPADGGFTDDQVQIETRQSETEW